jgi:glycosyltransferase 2 family protein
MKKAWIRIGLILLLTGGLLYFFFRSVESWDEVLRYLTDVNVFFAILIVVMVPLHFVTRTWRWNLLLKHEKTGISFYNRFAGNALGFTVSMLFPGRLGEIVRPFYLAKKEDMPKGFVLGTIVVERIFDIFTMCILLGLFLISQPLYASIFHVNQQMYSRLYFWGFVGLGAATFMMLVTLSLYFFRGKTLNVINFLLRPMPDKWTIKILLLVEEFIQGLKFFHSLKNLLAYIGLSFVVWLEIIFYYWIFFLAYNIDVSFFFLFPYVFMLMVGASIPTPGMVGGFHYFSKVGLTSFYGLDPNLAIGMTLVIHTVQFVVTCLTGYAILWKEGISLFQVKSLGETNNS